LSTAFAEGGDGVRLLTEEALATVAPPEPSTANVDAEALADPKAGPSLRAYLVLTESAELFINHGWSPEEVFWSRYYWFRRFCEVWAALTGSRDDGNEQWAFKILEYPYPKCQTDWSALEWVEPLAIEHAAAQLQR
jgi:hypothetical protein